MWMQIVHFFSYGRMWQQQRVDLQVVRVDRGRIGKTMRRVPDCYFHRKAGEWRCDHRNKDGASLLRRDDVPVYYMTRPILRLDAVTERDIHAAIDILKEKK